MKTLNPIVVPLMFLLTFSLHAQETIQNHHQQSDHEQLLLPVPDMPLYDYEREWHFAIGPTIGTSLNIHGIDRHNRSELVPRVGSSLGIGFQLAHTGSLSREAFPVLGLIGHLTYDHRSGALSSELDPGTTIDRDGNVVAANQREQIAGIEYSMLHSDLMVRWDVTRFVWGYHSYVGIQAGPAIDYLTHLTEWTGEIVETDRERYYEGAIVEPASLHRLHLGAKGGVYITSHPILLQLNYSRPFTEFQGDGGSSFGSLQMQLDIWFYTTRPTMSQVDDYGSDDYDYENNW